MDEEDRTKDRLWWQASLAIVRPELLKTIPNAMKSSTAFQFLCMALAINTDGQGLSNEVHHKLLPKKCKVMLYLPFITQ